MGLSSNFDVNSMLVPRLWMRRVWDIRLVFTLRPVPANVLCRPLVPLSAVQPPSAHFVLLSVQSLSEVAPCVFFCERCVAEAVPCCYENALKFQVSELGLGRYESELKSLVSEIAPGWPEAVLLAAVVCAATLFVSFTPVCFQSFEGSDGGLGPRFLKLSGPALLAAMIVLRPCMCMGIWVESSCDFYLLLKSARLSVPRKGEMKAKLPSLSVVFLKVCSGRGGPAAVSAVAYKSFFVMCASLGAAAASTCALKSVDSGSGILGVKVHEEAFPFQVVLTHTQKEVLAMPIVWSFALELNGVLLLYVHYVSLVLLCLGAAAFERLAKMVKAYLTAASPAAFVLSEVFEVQTSVLVTTTPSPQRALADLHGGPGQPLWKSQGPMEGGVTLPSGRRLHHG